MGLAAVIFTGYNAVKLPWAWRTPASAPKDRGRFR